MRYDDYLQSDTAQHVLQRAAHVGGTSIAVFDYADGHEGEPCTGCGPAAAACAYVGALPWGPQACRKSRGKAVTATLKRRKAVPFICHMGFSCVAMPALSTDETPVAMVLGPFCPSEAPDSLERDALEGLSKLENKPVDKLPFSLTDIPTSSAQTLPDVAEWLCETLTDGFQSLHSVDEEDSDQDARGQTPTKRRGWVPEKQTPFDSGAIVAALVGGDARQGRLLVHSQISDTASRRRTRISVKRARSVAVVASVIEWAEHADVDTSRCWDKFGAFQQAAQACNSDADLTTEAMKVLSPIHRQKNFPTKPATVWDYDFVPLNKLITTHFKEGILLSAVAKSLGENPTTITKRLQRVFGLSYSDYVGRMKVDHAKKLLRNTKLTVGEIGKRVGVNDATNFSKLFRKHEHTTPGKYRTQFGSKA